VVNQLDIISSTLAVLEQRIQSNENQASSAVDFFKNLNKQNEPASPKVEEEEDEVEQPPEMHRQPVFSE
jgi:hypothetical protein